MFSNFNSDQKETRAIKIAHAFVQDARIVLSLKRDASRPCFTSDEHNRIASARPVIGSLLACQWRGLGFSPIGSSQCFPLPAADDCRKPAAFRCLTKREMDIVAKVIDGYCNESIALDLNISIGTVKVHRKNIYRKLKISSQIELFRLAFRSDAAPAVIATTRSGRSLRSAVVTGGTQPGSGEERVRAAVGAEWF